MSKFDNHLLAELETAMKKKGIYPNPDPEKTRLAVGAAAKGELTDPADQEKKTERIERLRDKFRPIFTQLMLSAQEHRGFSNAYRGDLDKKLETLAKDTTVLEKNILKEALLEGMEEIDWKDADLENAIKSRIIARAEKRYLFGKEKISNIIKEICMKNSDVPKNQETPEVPAPEEPAVLGETQGSKKPAGNSPEKPKDSIKEITGKEFSENFSKIQAQIKTEKDLLDYLLSLGKLTIAKTDHDRFGEIYFPAYANGKIQDFFAGKDDPNTIGLSALREKVKEIIKNRKSAVKNTGAERIAYSPGVSLKNEPQTDDGYIQRTLKYQFEPEKEKNPDAEPEKQEKKDAAKFLIDEMKKRLKERVKAEKTVSADPNPKPLAENDSDLFFMAFSAGKDIVANEEEGSILQRIIEAKRKGTDFSFSEADDKLISDRMKEADLNGLVVDVFVKNKIDKEATRFKGKMAEEEMIVLKQKILQDILNSETIAKAKESFSRRRKSDPKALLEGDHAGRIRKFFNVKIEEQLKKENEFEEILGKEIVEKVEKAVQKDREKTMQKIKAHPEWKEEAEYKNEAKSILNQRSEWVIKEILVKILAMKNIEVTFDAKKKEEFSRFILKRIEK